MSFLTSKHDKSLCKRCNVVGKGILLKIRRLVEELEELLEKEVDGLDEDVRCIMKTERLEPPLISYPEETCRKEYHLELDKTTPVWDLRRYPSTELVGGDWSPCLCSRSYGLTEDCRRRHCRGRAGCFTSPPSCPASRRWNKPLTGPEVDRVISSYSSDRLQPCDQHALWTASCYKCRYYVNKIDKMMNSMCS